VVREPLMEVGSKGEVSQQGGGIGDADHEWERWGRKCWGEVTEKSRVQKGCRESYLGGGGRYSPTWADEREGGCRGG